MSWAAAVLVLALAAMTSDVRSAYADGKTVLLAVSVCPPYRDHIPTQVCRNAAEAIAGKLAPALGIAADDVTILVDADSTARNVLKTLEHYSATLTADDRLLFYLNLHGDAFYLWADAYRLTGQIKRIDEEYFSPREDVLVFWTAEEPAVPALALAQKDWLTVADLAAALGRISAKVGLILDSCSSNLWFASMKARVDDVGSIDFVATSSGSEQVSNFDASLQIPLFTQQLTAALHLPTALTFGQAVEQARVATVLDATALCATAAMPQAQYMALYSRPSPPAGPGGLVTPPLWYCAQVPIAIDFSGELSERPLHPTGR